PPSLHDALPIYAALAAVAATCTPRSDGDRGRWAQAPVANAKINPPGEPRRTAVAVAVATPPTTAVADSANTSCASPLPPKAAMRSPIVTASTIAIATAASIRV